MRTLVRPIAALWSAIAPIGPSRSRVGNQHLRESTNNSSLSANTRRIVSQAEINCLTLRCVTKHAARALRGLIRPANMSGSATIRRHRILVPAVTRYRSMESGFTSRSISLGSPVFRVSASTLQMTWSTVRIMHISVFKVYFQPTDLGSFSFIGVRFFCIHTHTFTRCHESHSAQCHSSRRAQDCSFVERKGFSAAGQYCGVTIPYNPCTPHS